jgi:arylsulfatase A-like enzyme
MAEVLRDAGYRTQIYATNGHIIVRNGFHQGFDGFEGIRFDRFTFDLVSLRERVLPSLVCGGARGILGTRSLCDLFNRAYGRLYDPGVVKWQGNGPRITEDGKRFLRLHEDERFFLWLYYMEPHTTYHPSKPFRPLPSEISPDRKQFLSHLGFWDLNGEEFIRPVDLQALISLYDGEIVDVDRLVGEVLDELERQGLTDRTVVILNSDHGEELSDHGDFTHGHTMYDELVRVPLIISGPGVKTPGRMVETQVRLLDLLPTVCDIADAAVPAEAKGRSLMPFLEGGQAMDELPAFSESLHTSIFEEKAVRQNGYKLIYDVKREEVELYHVQSDPHEQVDLADQEPEIAESMLADLKAWMVQSARTATELPRKRPMVQTLDDELRQQLRDAGY